jgi:hypothetical protein
MTTGPAIPRDAAWEEEGRLTAQRLTHVSSAIVLGADPERAARVAVGIARAESARRHVALGDLVGDLAPLYEIAGGEDAFGLSDCFREGLPLNDIARPAPDSPSLFILPAGTPPIATTSVLAHERWTRLVKGFAQAGALLLLVAPLDAPGLDALIAATDGVIVVDTPPLRVRRFPVIATVDIAEVIAPPPPPARNSRGLIIAAAVALLAIGGLVAWLRHGKAHGRAAGHARTAVTAPPPGAAATPARADTVRLTGPVNPGDSVASTAFSLEVVAANTLAGANSFVDKNRAKLQAAMPTVVPVTLDGRGTVWYKVMVGAWRDRANAESLLASLRSDGLVRSDQGRVLRAPYALLLSDSVARERSGQVEDEWRRRGIDAYALVQDNGSVRIFAGAFETPAQAAPLAALVRDAGRAPVVVFRTGGMF